jgi:hypothetical protein
MSVLFHRQLPAASPDPWAPSDAVATPSGAILIEDANGEIIGWATDAAGHTTEDVYPDRRHPDQILQNAVRLALAPELLACVRLIARAVPLTVARMQRVGANPHAELLAAGDAATSLLRRVGER